MVNLTIDNKAISFPPEPPLWKRQRQTESGSKIMLSERDQRDWRLPCLRCRNGGKRKLITSCNNIVEDGMVLYTNSPKVRMNRKNTVKLLLSQHDCQCAVCVQR